MKTFLGTLFGFLLIAQSAFSNLSISPFYLSFNADSNQRTQEVRLTNTSNKSQTYRIKLIHYRQQKDGTYVEISEKDDPFSATPYLEYSPREVTLDAYQTQTIRVHRKGMATAAPGEYVVHLMMQETEMPSLKSDAPQNGLSVNVRALYGITIPILVEKGDLSDNGRIRSIKSEINGDASFVRVTVSHDGTRSFFGKVVIFDDKKEIGRLDNFRIYVGNPERVLTIPLRRKPTGKLSIQLMDGRSNAILSTQDI